MVRRVGVIAVDATIRRERWITAATVMLLVLSIWVVIGSVQ